jgi:metal-responsive CopG/Arc/MetJ family transcriptional regulator
MRTTVTLDPDVAAAIDRRRHEEGRGLSEVVNDLIRAGLQSRPERPEFRQRTAPIGLRMDVVNVAEAIEQLDGPERP